VSGSALWPEVTAPGSSPEFVARLVARLVGPRGAPLTIAREAAARAGAERDEVLRALAPRPGAECAAAAGRAAAQWHALGVVAAIVGDPAYPAALADGWPATGAPPLVAWRGPVGGLPRRPAVAIVGARRASSYGTGVAGWLATAAGEAGCVVVSGGAVGIDAAAHEAAIAAGAPTVAVLGCGHARRYPRPHATRGGLFERLLAAGGCLVSELPPEAPPKPPNVLARNRLVAGIADAVVVVEGGERSGTLRTAAAALERGVPVLAVPGDVRAPGSAAPHRLLADGAAPCTGPRDLLEVVGGVGASADEHRPSGDGGERPSVLPDPVRAELVRRWPRPVRVDDLAGSVGVPVGGLLGALTRARIAGEVAEGAEGVRLRRAPERTHP
jgi:DNA processing protein